MSTTEEAFAADVVRRLQRAGHVALLAGGCVRDLQLGIRPSDFDVATDAEPDVVRTLFGKRSTLAVGEAFGVVIVLGPKNATPRPQVEVATFRREGEYTDGRRPDRVEFCTAAEDAARRDFTMNGLFLDPVSGELLDYVGGRADLTAGVVRAIGDPAERIAEDKLRMLRAVRFATRFGFRLSGETADAVRTNAPSLCVVSRERVAAELTKMLLHASRAEAIRQLVDLDLWPQVFPGVPEPSVESLATLGRLKNPQYATGVAALCDTLDAESVAALMRSLKASNADRDLAVGLVRDRGAVRDWAAMSRAERIRLATKSHAAELFALEASRALASGDDPTPAEAASAFLRDSPDKELRPQPLVTGEHLIAAGVRPSPRFKELLFDAMTAQLDGEVATTEQSLRRLGLK